MKKYFLILLLFFLLCFTLTLSAQEILSIYFLDVGQGDSAIIVSPSEEVILIDSGPDEKIILNYLQNLGISHIDLLIATHAHDDHITGMDKIIDKYKPRTFIDPGIPHTSNAYGRLLNSLQKNKIKHLTNSAQQFKYAASENSEVFHHINCSYVSSIKSDNLILFKTREEAITSGKRLCKKCNP